MDGIQGVQTETDELPHVPEYECSPVEDKENLTPEKLLVENCCVCGELKGATNRRQIGSKWGREIGLQGLLQKYGKINICQGIICKVCERRLIKLDADFQTFPKLCHSTAFKLKRCSADGDKPNKRVKLFMSSNPESTDKPTESSDHSYFAKSKLDQKKKNTTNMSQNFNHSSDVTPENNDSNWKSDMYTLLSHCNTATEFTQHILTIPSFYKYLMEKLVADVHLTLEGMRNKKHGFVSKLMAKGFDDLKSVKWDDLLSEFNAKFPFIYSLLTAFFPREVTAPKLGVIYAILMQEHYHELSLIQRLVSLLLIENICNEKMYDRLQPLGLCLSYGRSLKILDIIGSHFNSELIDAIKEDKKFRIVGDNVNWFEGVHDERKEKHSHMNHAFASAAIIQNHNFSHLSSEFAYKPVHECVVQDFIPNSDDIQSLKTDFCYIVGKVLFKHLSYFKFLNFVNKPIKEICPPGHAKNKVIPLPVVMCNEQKYDDVVQILDHYEEIVSNCCEAAGVCVDTRKFHIGGDQLTRERFSGAKRLRVGVDDTRHSFSHLSPITFEFFHMQMNFLQLIFKQLYDENSGEELGTFKSAQDRVCRYSVNTNINKAYDADKDFFLSFTDCHLVEAALEHFGMDDIHSSPTTSVPSEDILQGDEAVKKEWLLNEIGKMVDDLVLSDFQKDLCGANVEQEGEVFELLLPGGKVLKLLKIVKKSKPKEDRVKDYAHLVVQLGLLFKDMLEAVKLPNRDRFLPILKFAMILFKSNNNKSKYAFEILRLLVHQICALSQKEANEEFYGMFVNTKGHLTSHIPTDLQMEFLVKEVKKHIKHMFSNKTEHNIKSKSSALAGLQEIGNNFDKTSGVVVRSKKHSDVSTVGDESYIISDLRKLRPFKYTPGREHPSFKKLNKSLIHQLDLEHYHKWIHDRIPKFVIERGN